MSIRLPKGPSRLLRLPRLLLLLLLPGVVTPLGAEELRAPGAAAGPVDQLAVAGNACGPAALLASIRCGDAKWQALAGRLPGRSDKTKLLYIIRAHGLKPSTRLKDRQRWTRNGINAEDLLAVARELARLDGLAAPAGEELYRRPRESAQELLGRLHGRLRDSIAHGFPPILSLRRHARRNDSWPILQHHFVTIVGLPEELDRQADSFPITYFDPWGGRECRGTLRLPDGPLLCRQDEPSPCLEAVVPQADIGKRRLREGEGSAVVPALVIGRW